MIGAGAVVTKDVLPYIIVAGVPRARPKPYGRRHLHIARIKYSNKCYLTMRDNIGS